MPPSPEVDANIPGRDDRDVNGATCVAVLAVPAARP
jgi:hypothetical protein